MSFSLITLPAPHADMAFASISLCEPVLCHERRAAGPVLELALSSPGCSGPAPVLRLARSQPLPPSPPPSRATRRLLRRPLVLLASVPRPLVLFFAGAASGAIAKTLTAPLDRVKILLQVKGGLQTGSLGAAARAGSLLRSLVELGRAEGVAGYWKGNLPQVLRVVPHSAAQLLSYDVYKRALADEEGRLSVWKRLAAGAAAGMTATLLTYPLDTLRFRIAVDPSATGLVSTCRALLREGSGGAFYRGLGASLLGIAPYMALELATYDLLPQQLPSFARGLGAALVATVSCYPLDTVRRHVQMSAAGHVAWGAAAAELWGTEGLLGFYRGFVPSALKNLPNKGIKLSVFDKAKRLMALAQEARLEEEQERALDEAGVEKRAGILGFCKKVE